MDSPQEIEVWYVLPALRKAIAEELLRLGLKQTEIAKKLDVTEAAISHYIKSKRAAELKFSGDVKLKISQAAKRIANSQADLMEELQKLCSTVKNQGLLCRVHKKHSKSDLKSCRICETR